MTSKIDLLAASLDRKWGCGRLTKIVSRETAERFGYWRDQLADAQEADWQDPARLAALEGIVIRGWRALDAEAEKLGHQPMPAAWVEAEWAPGRVFAIAIDDEHRQALVLRNKAESRDVSVFTVADVAKLVESIPDVARIMELFPGAYVSTPPATAGLSGRRKAGLGDDISDILPLPEEVEA